MKSSYVKTILLAAIVLGSVIAFWFGVKVAFRTEYPLLTVASGSMVPTLNIGDLIVVQGISNVSELKAAPDPEGDIVVFQSPRVEGELIVHRAVNKTMYSGLWYIRTKGDANGGPDPWGNSPPDTWSDRISERLLIGKVVGKVPLIGYIPLEIRKPYGIALIVVLVVIIILAEFIPELSKKQKTTEG